MRPRAPAPSEAEQLKRKETFQSITACTNEEAAQYLESCIWNVNAAVELFLKKKSEDAGLRRRREIRRKRSSSGSSSVEEVVEEVTLSDDELDDKEAKEVNGNKKGLSTRGMAEPVPVVLGARMAFRSGPILQQSFAHQYGGNDIQHRGVGLVGAFDGFKDFRALAEQQKAEMMKSSLAKSEAAVKPVLSTMDKTRSLNSLFRPPIDILHAGDWKSAKAASMRLKRWVLVNVQDMKEFASHSLNRDVWSNGGVKELVKSNFLFWQVYLDSVDGRRMRNYYGVPSCPAVFIVDPRTGEKVVDVRLKPQDAVSICDKLTRFMDEFPDFDARDRSLVYQVAPETVAPRPDDAQSMEETVTSPAKTTNRGTLRKRKTNEDEEVHGKRSRVTDRDVDRLLEQSTRGLTMCDEDEWKKHVIPGGIPIKVMLRFPDGSRHSVEVSGATRLFALYQYIRGHGLLPDDHLFVLSFPKREYSTDRSDENLTQLGFSGSEMIHVETKH